MVRRVAVFMSREDTLDMKYQKGGLARSVLHLFTLALLLSAPLCY